MTDGATPPSSICSLRLVGLAMKDLLSGEFYDEV
jgi:hypothetical protein